MNLRWTWDRPTRDLFASIDELTWELTGHNPMKMLAIIPPARLEELARDESFIAALTDVARDLRSYADGPASDLGTIAYFSPEFGLSESIPIYSGGLGVLAGDHLKAASDLGLPMVAVGLLYWQGYFRQALDDDGWQHELYPGLDRDSVPTEPLTDSEGHPVTVEIDLAKSRRAIAPSITYVGRVPLLLLECEGVTDRLYGGKSEHRLRQEIVLGIGGVRALHAAGYEPEVWHSNEGHAVFLALERIRRMIVTDGMSFDDALEATRATTIFTTHTPVPAGIDRYGEKLMKRYFGAFAEECGVPFERLMDLGKATRGREFNMAALGLRVASRANGVSKLHGRVARAMFSPLWPGDGRDLRSPG
jgi:starch phosphorylase